MAGGRPFSQKRLDTWRSIIRAILRQRGERFTAGQVDAIMYKIDRDHYAMTGKSLTGASWYKGKKYPYPGTAKGERR
jgi:hypothetical protein